MGLLRLIRIAVRFERMRRENPELVDGHEALRAILVCFEEYGYPDPDCTDR